MLTIDDFRSEPGFEALVSRIRSLGGDHEMFGFDFVGGYALQQNPEELAALLLSLRGDVPRLRMYLEIGSASGGTAKLMMEQFGFGSQMLIDDGNHPRAGELSANVGPWAHVVRADSHAPETWTVVSDWLDASPRQAWTGGVNDVLAFIDGDHSFQGARLDLALVEDTCGEGTFVVMHDIVACDGVARAWAEAASLQPIAEFIADERPLGIGVGRIR